MPQLQRVLQFLVNEPMKSVRGRALDGLRVHLDFHDVLFQVLRQDVLSGRHAPDIKLKLDSLQSLYGFSSSPLREALNRLVQEGLVKADERRGFRVTPISPADLADITKMRLMLVS